MLKRIAAAVVVLMALCAGAVAGLLEDGFAAAQRGDYATAMKLWRPLAERGDAAAQFNLGTMYTNGWGVPQDYTEAVRWFRLAAEQGYAMSQASLGVMYVRGQGVRQDDAEAVRWFRFAAEQGDAMAQTSLGIAYERGGGVPQDYVLAHMWFNLAAAQGDAIAAEFRDDVASLMTPDQIAEAQRMAREYLAAHGN